MIKLIQAEKLRRILVSVFYAAAAAVLIYLAADAQTVEGRARYLCLLVLFPFGIYYEILRYLYARANELIYTACDAEGCLRLAEKAEKADFTHQFRIQICYLKGFALLDLNRSGEAEQVLEQEAGTELTAKRKLDFEYNYLMFQLAAVRNDRKELKAYYEKICRIFNLGRRINNGVKSLEAVIRGTYLTLTRQYQQAEKAFDIVRIQDLKRREQAYYCYYLSACEYALGKKKQAEKTYEKACATAPGLPYITGVDPCDSQPDAGEKKYRNGK